MAIEAPISKFKKNNIKIYIVLCVIAALFFGYDGYLSKYKWSRRYSFYEKHVIDGKPDNDMKFNQNSPPFFAGAALCLYAYYRLIKNRKLLAEEFLMTPYKKLIKLILNPKVILLSHITKTAKK